jgi:hypothetical protein
MKEVLLFLFFISTGIEFLNAQNINIKGKLLDVEEQMPVSNAHVTINTEDSLYLKNTTTRSDGRFEIENLYPGT